MTTGVFQLLKYDIRYNALSIDIFKNFETRIPSPESTRKKADIRLNETGPANAT